MGQGSEFQDNNNPSQDGGSPFSADLKGDFSSSFGTNTNAVSQIFKEGGFVGENKTRLMVLVGVLVLVIAGALFYLSSGDSHDEEDFVVTDDMDDEMGLDEDVEDLADKKPGLPQDKPPSQSALPMSEPDLPVPMAEDPLPSPADNLPSYESEPMGSTGGGDGWPVATVAPSIVGPSDGFQRTYDETSTPPAFSWEGSPGGWVVLSTSPDMNPVKFKRKANGNSLTIRKLMPGTWYWQVRNGAGVSAVRSFTIQEPLLRNLALSSPTEGGAFAGNGGVVNWTGDQKVSFYRVEFSTDDSWANPAYRFATSGTQLQVRDVAAGSYRLRLGAFSEVSGRWEYTSPINVTIQ